MSPICLLTSEDVKHQFIIITARLWRVTQRRAEHVRHTGVTRQMSLLPNPHLCRCFCSRHKILRVFSTQAKSNSKIRNMQRVERETETETDRQRQRDRGGAERQTDRQTEEPRERGEPREREEEEEQRERGGSRERERRRRRRSRERESNRQKRGDIRES